MSKANAVEAVTVQSVERLPDGVTVLLVSCESHEGFVSLPHVISYEGAYYGRTGWNSDRGVAYFRSDARIAVTACRANGQDRYPYWK